MQIFVTANLHPTSLESRYNVERRLTDYDLEVAVVNGSDFVAPESSVDSVVISAYFNAFDSFYVEKDLMKLMFAILYVILNVEFTYRTFAINLFLYLTIN